MVYKIIWSPLALETYISNIQYLQQEWTEKEIARFIDAVEKKLQLLKTFPEIGTPTIKQHNLRKTLIVKRIALIYRYKKGSKKVELVQFFNTWQHPVRMRRK